MANIIPDGEYYLYNAGSTSRCMDVVAGAVQKANAAINLFDCLKNNAQVWTIKNEGADGATIGITCRLYGNKIGPADTSATAAVKLNASGTGVPKNVKWTVEETGNKISVGGVEYPTYYLKANGYNLYAAGTTNGSPIRMSTGTAVSSQWAFVPVKQIDDGGLFEIRSVIDTKMALDVMNYGTLNGANLQINAATGGNNQKFQINKLAENQYAIRAINSGRYLDVDSAKAKNGQNVAIWDNNNTRAQRWKILEYDDKQKVDGVECLTVSFGSYVEATGDKYMMDIEAGKAQPFQNVAIWDTNHSSAQRFLLKPTEATDPTMPVPHTVGVSNGDSGDRKTWGYVGENSTPTWSCSPAWCADNGTNHYEIRTRSRTMASATSSWRSWSEWSSWSVPPLKIASTRSWYVGDPLFGGYEWAQAKNMEVEIQVRSAGADELSLLHSGTADQVVNIYRKPAVSITAVGWTPDGLRIGFSSDYCYGTTYANIVDIRKDGKSVWNFVGSYIASFNGATGSVLILREFITTKIADGDIIDIVYQVGYDQQVVCDGRITHSIAVEYDSGTVDITPVFEKSGAHMYARVKRLGEGANIGGSRLWVEHNLAVVECPLIEQTDTEDIYEVLYPTNGDDCLVFTEACSKDQSIWGTDVSPVRFRKMSYAWTIGNKTIYLAYSIDDRARTNEQYAANYQADSLDAREYQSVSFGATRSATHTAVGIVLHDEKGQDPTDDFIALVGKHAVYRDIAGGIYDVAITDVQVSRGYGYDDIVITMIQETV